MTRKLVFLTIAFCLAVLLSGCGSSSAPLKDPPLYVTTPSPLPPGIVNVPYSTTLNATGGAPPYAWNHCCPGKLSR